MRQLIALLTMLCASLALAGEANAEWAATWTASAHGPYPVGNPTAQPELKFAFPVPEQGARDQSFRLVVPPGVWGSQARIRLSNAFGTRPVTFDGVCVGLQESGSAIVEGTNAAVQFGGKETVTVAPGDRVVSDPVPLAFVKSAADPLLRGRKLSVS